MQNTHKKIIVGMSGGVDSSVSALLLKEQGHDISGVFMKNWEEDDTDTFCSARADMADAQAICDQLQIELYKVNFAAEYWQYVFNHFLAEYRAGRTPNPDILCNKEIKFKAFLDFAKQKGANYIAMGHYARTSKGQLLKGLDNNKDQSYFLHALSKEQLMQSLFPIGELEKSQVRELAQKAGFKNHNKKDSTGICFIGERKFKSFLNQYLPAQPGDIETSNGKVIGRHDGLMFYTLGQRQGLHIGGMRDTKEAPWYVAAKNIKRNVLVVVQETDNPLLYCKHLFTENVNWIDEPKEYPFICYAKTRYRQKDQACIIHKLANQQYKIEFEIPQRAVTPGQSVVFYQNDHCLGGGIIKDNL